MAHEPRALWRVPARNGDAPEQPSTKGRGTTSESASRPRATWSSDLATRHTTCKREARPNRRIAIREANARVKGGTRGSATETDRGKRKRPRTYPSEQVKEPFVSLVAFQSFCALWPRPAPFARPTDTEENTLLHRTVELSFRLFRVVVPDTFAPAGWAAAPRIRIDTVTRNPAPAGRRARVSER